MSSLVFLLVMYTGHGYKSFYQYNSEKECLDRAATHAGLECIGVIRLKKSIISEPEAEKKFDMKNWF